MHYFFYNTDSGSLRAESRPRYRLLVQSGFAAVSGPRQKFGVQFEQLAPGDILLMYENAVGVVAVGRVRERWDGVSHEMALYYTADEVGVAGEGRYEYRVPVDWSDMSEVPIDLATLRHRLGYLPRGAVTRIDKHRREVAALLDDIVSGATLMPGEIASPQVFVEGAAVQVSVNAYERNREAVEQCKKIRGTVCVICGFDFAKAYGEEFAGFIHVHHLTPLHQIRTQYAVNPETDLIPVCPNCHAVVHHGGRLRSPDEIRVLLRAHQTEGRRM